MNRVEFPIQQMSEAAGKIIFGEMFSVPKDEDPKWVKQTWERVVAAIESALIYFPDTAMDKLTRHRIREAALSEAADWHQGEAERKRACAEKNRTLRAQISTHLVSEAAIRSLAANVCSMVSEPSVAHDLALDMSVLERLANTAAHYDTPDDNGPFPDMQDAMVTVGDLRNVRKLFVELSALEPSPRQQALEEKPAAYLRQKDIDRLSSCHPGAINVQISNTPFMGFLVPVFTTLSQPISDHADAGNMVADGCNRKFKLGERLTKNKGSSWTGQVVGFYSTEFTPIGYAIESETEKGSVQIYPEAALRPLPSAPGASE